MRALAGRRRLGRSRTSARKNSSAGSSRGATGLTGGFERAARNSSGGSWPPTMRTSKPLNRGRMSGTKRCSPEIVPIPRSGRSSGSAAPGSASRRRAASASPAREIGHRVLRVPRVDAMLLRAQAAWCSLKTPTLANLQQRAAVRRPNGRGTSARKGRSGRTARGVSATLPGGCESTASPGCRDPRGGRQSPRFRTRGRPPRRRAPRAPAAGRGRRKSSSSRGASSERTNSARLGRPPGGISTRRTSTPSCRMASSRGGTDSSNKSGTGRSTAVTSWPAARSSSRIVQAAIVLPE
jgi:hypothetical protein